MRLHDDLHIDPAVGLRDAGTGPYDISFGCSGFDFECNPVVQGIVNAHRGKNLFVEHKPAVRAHKKRLVPGLMFQLSPGMLL